MIESPLQISKDAIRAKEASARKRVEAREEERERGRKTKREQDGERERDQPSPLKRDKRAERESKFSKNIKRKYKNIPPPAAFAPAKSTIRREE